jgi:hypothetical protein
MDPAASRLLDQARESSPTVGRLVALLEASDVIVMVSVTMLPGGISGDTRFLATTAAVRIVQVRIDNRQPRSAQMAWLGHELQHAAEVAGAQEVRSSADLAGLMKRIGHAHGQRRLFETAAAVQCGRLVSREAANAER